MRLVIQRVTEACVRVDGQVVGSCQRGFMVLVGVENGDTLEDVAYCEPDYGKAYIAAKPNVKGLH